MIRTLRDAYPFAPRYLTLRGHALHYMDTGSGPAVVMVHGNPTWSFYFRHLAKTLSPRFRVVAPDHIGCGLSDKPDPDRYDYTLASRVQDLSDLICHAVPEGRISLVVHDWGGMIGLAWALNHPDRVDRIVITNTAGFLLPAAKRFPAILWAPRHWHWLAVPAIQGLNLFCIAALYLAATSRLAPAVRQGLLAPYNSFKNRIAVLRFVQDIPLAPDDPAFAIARQVDQNLSCLNPDKVLLLWGAKDPVFDLDFLEEFRRRLPGARSHVFDDAGHYLFEDRPRETAGLIHDFFSQSL